jgi:Subtilase family
MLMTKNLKVMVTVPMGTDLIAGLGATPEAHVAGGDDVLSELAQAAQSSIIGFEPDTSFTPVWQDAFADGIGAKPSNEAPQPIRAVDLPQAILRGQVEISELDRVSTLVDAAGRPRVYSDPEISSLACFGDDPVKSVDDACGLLQRTALHSGGMDGNEVAVALVDEGINVAHLESLGFTVDFDNQLGVSTRFGQQQGEASMDFAGHGTLCAFNVLSMAPRVKLIDCAILPLSKPQGFLTGLVSDALSAFKKLNTVWANRAAHNFKSLIVSNSWGMYNVNDDEFPKGAPGRYVDNPLHPLRAEIAKLTGAGADVVFASGNCGPQCAHGRCKFPNMPTIVGANSYPEVVTIGGLTTDNNSAGYSSIGPGIFEVHKPDLVCYTHYTGSQVRGQQQPDSGTSTACALAAGTLAAIRSSFHFDPNIARRSPAALKATLIETAKQPDGSVGFQNETGFGLIDPSPFLPMS